MVDESIDGVVAAKPKAEGLLRCVVSALTRKQRSVAVLDPDCVPCSKMKYQAVSMFIDNLGSKMGRMDDKYLFVLLGVFTYMSGNDCGDR